MDRSLIRGADTRFIFDLPCGCTEITSAKVIFWQPSNQQLPITKPINDIIAAQLSDKQLKVDLTKTETLKFSDKRKAYVQIALTKTDSTCVPGLAEMITVYPARDELFASAT